MKLKTRHVYSYSSTNFSSHLLPIQGHIYFIGIVNKPTTLLLEQNSFLLNYRVVSLSILQFIGVFPKWNRNSVIPGNLINHWSMNWSRFKDPVSHMCLAGTVVASWFSTQKMAGLNPFTVMRVIFVTEFTVCVFFLSGDKSWKILAPYLDILPY